MRTAGADLRSFWGSIVLEPRVRNPGCGAALVLEATSFHNQRKPTTKQPAKKEQQQQQQQQQQQKRQHRWRFHRWRFHRWRFQFFDFFKSLTAVAGPHESAESAVGNGTGRRAEELLLPGHIVIVIATAILPQTCRGGNCSSVGKMVSVVSEESHARDSVPSFKNAWWRTISCLCRM